MEQLESRLKTYLTAADIDEIRRAYVFGDKAHEGQLRLTGEPYIGHPLAVAGILADMKMDAKSIVASLLHDVVEDTDIPINLIASEFGDEVGLLVDGVTKLTQAHFDTKEDAQAANYRKMFMAISGDIRVIMVKLADRLHNMRTAEYLPRHKRRGMARETLEIYAPIANRLGMHKFRLELEELGFAALYPTRYRVLNEAVRKARGNRDNLLEKIDAPIRDSLREEGIAFTMVAREKHLYSLYRKMRANRLPFSMVYDVYALRLIVKSVDACYRALGIVHNTFKPVPGKFKDYIAAPKANGYQSLHTSLISPFGVPMEIQIRTEEMDQVANEGIASHWLYKSDEGANQDIRAQKRVRDWINELLELQTMAGDSSEFLESVKVDLFPDEVYVYTPKGDIMTLPAGSTVVDFAYAVHSDVGDHCAAARVDRQLAPLSSPLSTGSTVEIITTESATPNPRWLNFVVTSRARTSIRHYLKSLNSEKARQLGRRLLERDLHSHGTSLGKLDPDAVPDLLRDLHLQNLDELLEAIGLGKQIAPLVARNLSGISRLAPGDDDGKRPVRSGLRQTLSKMAPSWLRGDSDDGRSLPLAIRGTEGVVVSYARCCRPIPGDRIRGFMSAGKGVVVHVANCPNTRSFQKNPDRWLDLSWDPTPDLQFPLDIRIEVINQRGILAVMATAIADMGSNIDNVTIENLDGHNAVINITLEVRDRVHLARIIKKLRKIKGVNRIYRKRG